MMPRLRLKLTYGPHTIRVLYDSDWQEFVVRFYRDGIYNPGANYFTPDKEDAEGTAKAVLKQWVGHDITPLIHVN